MAHYAKVLDGKVIKVIKAEADFFDSFIDDTPGEWIQTSYNTRGNIHYGPDGNPDDGVALRGNYAGIGYVYDKENDVFYSEKPFASWSMNVNMWAWEAPIPMPTDDKHYMWNEASASWVEVA
jgi:hypothetical protein